MDRRLSRQELKDLIYRRRYLVPNAVTVGNMFCGFLAIIYASTERFDKAVIAVLVAVLLDGLDGRVARRLNATSKFGIEFDSFSDLVSFGIAPAILTYYWAFHLLAGDLGVVFTFFYTLCAASRLARFNIADENLKSFMGLPTPGAAVFVVACVNSYPYPMSSYLFIGIAIALMSCIGYLMVSTIEFYSIKQFKFSGVKLRWRLALGLLLALAWYNNAIGLLLISGLYVMSGPFRRIKSLRSQTQSA